MKRLYYVPTSTDANTVAKTVNEEAVNLIIDFSCKAEYGHIEFATDFIHSLESELKIFFDDNCIEGYFELDEEDK